MIKDKTIYFGHGTTLVWSTICGGSIRIQYIKPPQEIGSTPTKEQYNGLEVLDTIVLNVSYHDLKLMGDILKQKVQSVEIDGYVLDFSLFNKESVMVVYNAIRNATIGLQICLAC